MHFLLVIGEELENFEFADILQVGIRALWRNGKISVTGPGEGDLVQMKHVDPLNIVDKSHGSKDAVSELPHDDVLHVTSLAVTTQGEQVLKN